MRQFPLLLAMLSFLALPTWAADTSADIGKLPKTLQNLVQHWHLKVIKRFDTDAPEITGYLVAGPDKKTGILYTYKDFVISGSLIDGQGRNLTQEYAKAYMPKPPLDKVAAALAKDATLVSEGAKDAPEVYVFADPNCIFCHKFWKESRDWVNSGKVRLHWVMVGFLKPDSEAKAAAILAADKPVEALAKNEEKFDAGHESGGIKPLDKVPEDLAKTLKHHGELMAQGQYTGTPALLFKDTEGQWQGITGMPKLDALAPKLGIKTDAKP